VAPDDPTPDDVDEPEADLLPDDPSESLGPEPPRPPRFDQEDADPELKKQFWSLVLLFNVALFGMSLGLMLVGFESRWKVGGAIFAAGALAFLRGWRGYQDATSDA
jgi:hypothetical protein